MLVQIEVVKYLIEKGPGRTALEIAEALFSSSGYQQLVNQDCYRLANGGGVERIGSGTPGDPYRYYPKQG